MYCEIKQCRLCHRPDLETVVNLGMMHLTGVFPKNKETPLEKGPLELVKCNNCGLVQLRHSFSPDQLYGETYGYRSGLNNSMVSHLSSIVSEIETKLSLKSGDLIVDIGSNDGTLLHAYSQKGLNLVGIDPSGAKFSHYYRQDVTLIPEFFSKVSLQQAVGSKKAKVITSISMFYDLEDPVQFAQDVKDSLDTDGIWVLEQSYLPLMLERNSYDTICHEHLEYYALRQIMLIAEKTGQKVIDVSLNDTNGGSFRVICTHTESSIQPNQKMIDQLLQLESSMGIETSECYRAFNERIADSRRAVRHFLNEAKRHGKRIVGYGASTKGNVLLQYCGITGQDIECIAEVNEDKYGCVTPGSHIPILPEKEVRASNPDVFLVLPWHFRDMIVQKEKAFLQSGGSLLFPLPIVETTQ